MGLTNPQYDKIRRDYDRKQLENRAVQEARMQEVYGRLPRLREMDETTADLAYQRAKRLLAGDQASADKLAGQLQEIKEGKQVLLTSAGYPVDYLELPFHCPFCRDTGYVDGKRCRCFEQAIVDMLFSQHPIHERLDQENFSTFSLEYYDREAPPGGGESPYEHMKQILAQSKRFVQNFQPGLENLLLTGSAGTGKTFLSNCIAGALMKKGVSVIYLSANQLFEALADHAYSREEPEQEEYYHWVLDSDLLIVDDLGTELNNSLVSSELFCCLNERELRRKSTIISTNLTMNQIRASYSERVASRLMENYRLLRLFNSDIRLKKREERLGLAVNTKDGIKDGGK
ncbi:ATP-binding protein [Hominifimenecus sp. rT4P-3]|uniref:ATP-binding protein n=1 Tax=Hominifimenecus sp. rT4P-3 TaxID=3242979 RepID=UPI003DA2DE8A